MTHEARLREMAAGKQGYFLNDAELRTIHQGDSAACDAGATALMPLTLIINVISYLLSGSHADPFKKVESR